LTEFYSARDREYNPLTSWRVNVAVGSKGDILALASHFRFALDS
jgi:hypothetical protein